MEQMYLISDAAKKVQVESHVLRYWEEELELPIKRNELGHRHYSKADISRFQEIKRMKDTGIGLKAIKTLFEQNSASASEEPVAALQQITSFQYVLPKDTSEPIEHNTREQEEKNARLQYLLKQFIMEAVRDSNQSMLREVKDTLLKELDYQFRNQEEREEKREENRIAREESYYRKLDETLRSKTEKGKRKKHSLL